VLCGQGNSQRSKNEYETQKATVIRRPLAEVFHKPVSVATKDDGGNVRFVGRF
jgi:hypothetical protein